MKKIYLCLAFVLYAVGVFVIVDWIVFAENDQSDSFYELKAIYISHFPEFLQSFFNERLSALVFVFTFTVAGLIFLDHKSRGYRILGISSFLLAFWEIFSLM